jgi:hypothetical protein
MCRCSMEREGTACLNLIQQTEGLTRVVVIPQTERSGSHGTSAVQQRRAASREKREAGGGWVVAGALSDEDEQRFRHLVYAVRTVSRDGRMREQANSHWRCCGTYLCGAEKPTRHHHQHHLPVCFYSGYTLLARA